MCINTQIHGYIPVHIYIYIYVYIYIYIHSSLPKKSKLVGEPTVHYCPIHFVLAYVRRIHSCALKQSSHFQLKIHIRAYNPWLVRRLLILRSARVPVCVCMCVFVLVCVSVCACVCVCMRKRERERDSPPSHHVQVIMTLKQQRKASQQVCVCVFVCA